MLTLTASYREGDTVTRETIQADTYEQAWEQAWGARSETRKLLHVVVER
ncbi:hypothetical protein ACLM5J_09670 [Nocardioides sp. Bht2]